MDDYAVLGLDPDADISAVRGAYKRLSATAHPDRHGNDTAATDRFRSIRAAYDRLTKLLSQLVVEVDLSVLLFGGRVSFPHGGVRWSLVVPPRSGVGVELDAMGGDDRTLTVRLAGIPPIGWRLARDTDGALETDLIVTWLAAYRGDTVPVTSPTGETLLVELAPGSDTGMVVTLPGLGLPTRQGRGPAHVRLRLVPPPAGSQRLIDALEDPWA